MLIWVVLAATCALSGCAITDRDATVRSGDTVLLVPAAYLMMPANGEETGALLLAQHPTFRPYANYDDQNEIIPDDGLVVLVTKTDGISTQQDIEKGLAGVFYDALDDVTYDRGAGLITRCSKNGRVPHRNCSIKFDYNRDLYVQVTFDDRLLGSKEAIRAGAINLVAGFERAAAESRSESGKRDGTLK